jgi:hypothetical protein
VSALVKATGADNEYTLTRGQESVWVTVLNPDKSTGGHISVYIKRTDEGVIVDLFALDHENENAVGTVGVMFSDAQEWADRCPWCFGRGFTGTTKRQCKKCAGTGYQKDTPSRKAVEGE